MGRRDGAFWRIILKLVLPIGGHVLSFGRCLQSEHSQICLRTPIWVPKGKDGLRKYVLVACSGIEVRNRDGLGI